MRRGRPAGGGVSYLGPIAVPHTLLQNHILLTYQIWSLGSTRQNMSWGYKLVFDGQSQIAIQYIVYTLYCLLQFILCSNEHKFLVIKVQRTEFSLNCILHGFSLLLDLSGQLLKCCKILDIFCKKTFASHIPKEATLLINNNMKHGFQNSTSILERKNT